MSQPNFAAAHYSPRARAYVTSAVHSAGADLDQIEVELRGLGTTREAARVLARLSQLAARNPEMGRFSAAGCRKVGTTARISFCYRNTIRGDPGRRLAG